MHGVAIVILNPRENKRKTTLRQYSQGNVLLENAIEFNPLIYLTKCF